MLETPAGPAVGKAPTLARFLIPVVALLSLAGCGGGGGGGEPANRAPSASFTATPTGGEAPLLVTFNATASADPDGTITSYAWTFGDGAAGTGVTPTHTYTSASTFTVTLTVTDNDGATASTTRTVTVTDGQQTNVTVSGRITFERVPFAAALADGLNYPGTFAAPAREVEVHLVRSSDQALIAATATDANGNYSFTAPANTSVFVRARAVSRFAGSAGRPARWDLQVLNNTNANALYVLDGSAFNTGVTNHVRNLTAETGWGGDFAGVYTGVRAAAPFAILDTLYASVQFVIAEGSNTVDLPALSAYWSPNNVPSDDFKPEIGQIVTTLYQSGTASPAIYILGAASNDTDEFDQHILAHEFQHYLEDNLSRADSIGGSHSFNERLDMRVAFSEGFSNAFSAMVLADPLYRDSYGIAQGSDFNFSLESTATSSPGWYNEASVQRIVWDLFDDANEAGDTVSIGYTPMYDVFRNTLRTGVPLTSLFPFITSLKQQPGVPVAGVDARVQAEGVAGTSLGIDSVNMNAYATTETHSGVSASSADLVLPIYSIIVPNGSSVRVCGASEVDVPGGSVIGSGNKLGNRRFLRFSVPTARNLRVRVECQVSDPSCSGTPTPDPDFVLRSGLLGAISDSGDPYVEDGVFSVNAGDYVLEVYDYSHIDPAADDADRRGRTCMTVTITG